jgi:predicted GNAT family acetyltransferase
MSSETYRAHTVSVAISVAPEAVYIYASDPMNLPEWVPGFVKTIEQRGDAWVAESSLGPATFRFVPKNTLGVLDHQLELASGTFYSPMRVIANGTGSEVLFTVPEAGIGAAARHPRTVNHEEHGDSGAFFLERDGARIAEMTYQRVAASRILIDHTFVDPSLRGQGVARQLLDAAVAWARATHVKMGATCSYVVVQFARDSSLRDVIG